MAGVFFFANPLLIIHPAVTANILRVEARGIFCLYRNRYGFADCRINVFITIAKYYNSYSGIGKSIVEHNSENVISQKRFTVCY